MRQSHQRSVSTQLQIINATSSGRAVFSELSGAPHEVMIFPYDFQDSSSWRANTANFKTLGITTSHDAIVKQDFVGTVRVTPSDPTWRKKYVRARAPTLGDGANGLAGPRRALHARPPDEDSDEWRLRKPRRVLGSSH